MSGQIPAFSESDPRWVRLDALSAMLGISHAQMRRTRKRLANVAEYLPEKPGQPVWVYAPAWLPAKHRLDGGQSVATTAEIDDDRLFKRARREKAEIERDELRRLLIHADEVREIFDAAAAAIHQALDASNDAAFTELVIERLTRVEKELEEKLANGRRDG